MDPNARLASMKREFGEWGGVNASIEASSTFTVLHPETLPRIFAGEFGPDKGNCYLYGRSFNPTVRHLGRQLAAIEGTEAAYCCASGLAAISCALLQLCNSGDHMVASNTVYGGTFALLKDFLPAKCGISTTFVDITDHQAVKAAFNNKTKVLFTEVVSNPTLVVADLPELAAIAHQQGVKLVVDNTFTPMVVSPAVWGADVVLHSMTKFINGASDIVAGAVCGSQAFISSLLDLHLGPMMILGPTMDPKVASEISLRIPHLSLRMQEHSRRALYYAQNMHKLGAPVTYPGLPHHPQHHVMAKIANPGYGFGGLLTIDMGTMKAAYQLMDHLQNKEGFGLIAVSLGYFDTLMSVSGATTSSELTEQEREAAGISGGLLRLSVGISGTMQQRWDQLQQAWSHVVNNAHGSPKIQKVDADAAVQEEAGAPTAAPKRPRVPLEPRLEEQQQQHEKEEAAKRIRVQG